MLLSPSCLCCLPGRQLFPCLLASASLFPPAPLFCLVLSARLVVRCPGCCVWLPPFRGFGLFCWRGLFFVWLGLFGASLCCLSLAGFSVLRFCFCWLRLTSYWTGTFVYFAFTCTTKALIYHCTCVSVRRLDRFTCTIDFHRSTTSLLYCYCVTIRRVLR